MRARLALLTTLILFAGLVPTAVAAPPDHAKAAAAATAADRAAVVAYWTPERLATAVPADVLLEGRAAPRGGPVPTGAPAIVEPMAKPGGGNGNGNGNGGGGGGGGGGATVGGATWIDGGTVAETTGKVFFSMGGLNYVCSGSAVASSHGNLVLTAGHCLKDGSGEWATNFVFIPAYDGNGQNQSGPYGVWPATDLHTTSQWANQDNLDYDVGFARVANPGSGGSLSATVGAQGIGFNQPTGAHVYAFGYPHASPYDGSVLTYCAGSTTPEPYGGTPQGVVCDMTGGSSGGPWYAEFDASTGEGVAYSVNSYGYTRGRHSDKMFGPYFGSAVQSLYQAAS